MNNFFVITNKSKDVNLDITGEVISFINKHDKVCTGSACTDTCCNATDYDLIKKQISSETECIIVLGGDGTILRTARYLYELNIPFLGVNLGHLGYLTEGNESNLESLLSKVFEDDYVLEDRMLISGTNEAGDKCIALNDITLARNNSLKMFDFNLYVNGSMLYSYTADGIVISTPTGSTAYNLSLGGPIVEPTAKLFLITPIAPHSLNNRSLVLSADDEIELELLGSNKGETIEFLIYFDGDSYVKVKPGERVKIVSEPSSVKLVRLSSQSFLETLKEKMQ